MSFPDMFRHQMDAMKLYVNSKLEQTINRIPGHTLLSSLRQSDKHQNDSQDNIVDEQFSLLSHFESILVELQALLVWDNPANSAFALTFFTIFYWVLAWLHPSILTCGALIGFSYHSYEMWIRYVWPAIRVPELATEENERWTKMNINTLTAPEIEHYIERTKLAFIRAFTSVAAFRAESHGKFCGLSVSVFTVLYFVTKNIPGVLFIYGIAITIFLTPGILLHLLPKEFLETILDYCLNESSSTTNPSSTSPSSSSSSTTTTTTSSSSVQENNADDTAQSDISAFNESSELTLDKATEKEAIKCASLEPSQPKHEECNALSSEQSVEQVPAVHLPLDISPEVEQALFSAPVTMAPIHYSEPCKQTEQFEASTETETDTKESTSDGDSSSFTSTSLLNVPISKPDNNDDDKQQEAEAPEEENSEEECLVKSNYCENFFTLDRQSQSRNNDPIHMKCEREEDTLGEDYEIISDSEVELLTSKRHF